jgi:hypothetical protein
MKMRKYGHLLGGAILIAGCALLLSGCLFGGGDNADDGTTSGTIRLSGVSTTVASLADAGQQPILVSPADRYSSFQSKDPFVQQQEPEETDDTSTPATTTPSASTTTTTNSTSSTTTSSTSTTSTSSTTSTTSFYTHMLQILSVGDVDGSAAVTFQVDNNVYVDQHVGNKVSTSWGDVTVVDINVGTKTVSLLHDSKTLPMTEHQILFE